MLFQKSYVVGKRFLTPTVLSLKLSPLNNFSFQPGDYINILLPESAGGVGIKVCSFSIASPPEISPMEVCVKLIPNSDMSEYIRNLMVGDAVDFQGPFLQFRYSDFQDRNLCFISTGTGLAPFRAIITSKEYKLTPPKKSLIIAGFTNFVESLYMEDLKSCTVVQCIQEELPKEHANRHYRGTVVDYLLANKLELFPEDTSIYICGNPFMAKEAYTILLAQHFEPENIFLGYGIPAPVLQAAAERSAFAEN